MVNDAGVEELVTDKGYHSGPCLVAMAEMGVRSYIPEPRKAAANGSTNPNNKRRCMPTGGASQANAASAYCGGAVSFWNGPSRINTKPAACGECMSKAAMRSPNEC